MNKTSKSASAVCVTMWLACSAVNAALIAYDGFNYGPAGSDLNGNNGGIGFSGPWAPGGFNASINNNYDIANGSLSFGALSTSGNSVSTPAVTAIAGLTRTLVAPLGVDGTTRYFSFLLQPQGTLNGGIFNGFFGLVFEAPGEPEVFMGKPGDGAIDRYVIENRGGAGQVASTVAPVVGQTAFVVVRADFMAGNDLFTMYVNPTPGALEPLSGIVKGDANIGIFNALTLYSSGAFAVDELRVGETFADVTPVTTNVPDAGPGLMVALTTIASLLACGRRKFEA
jgi:hypothetical protein